MPSVTQVANNNNTMSVKLAVKGGLPIDEREKAETLKIFTPAITCQRP